MTITYQPELRDLLHAARAWEAHQSKIARRIMAGMLLACGGLVTWAGWHTWGMVFLAVAMLELFNLLPSSAIRAVIEFRGNPKFSEEYHLTLTYEHLHFQTATIDSTLKWTHYSDYFETSKAFILVYGKRMYTVIPKRALTDTGQLDQARSLLARVVRRG